MKNGVLFQSFEWHSNGDRFYERLADMAGSLREAGISAVWLPPVFKATSGFDVGYGSYDLYDLGEFDQKGSIRTKYGTKEELLNCIKALQDAGLEVYADVVLNHKAGADETELIQAVPVDPEDRNHELESPREIEAWTHFTFPGRGETYSPFKWSWMHFTGVDLDNRTGDQGIFKLLGENKDWAADVSKEKGNFDYLMFADIDHGHPDVRDELFRWSDWFVKETGVNGFRMDAVKHISAQFMADFINHVHDVQGPDFYFVGEYWLYDENVTNRYLYKTEYDMDLFDVGLHFNFEQAAKAGDQYDLRQIFDNSIVQEHPQLAVTFVDNHDSQPDQSLASWIDNWFKPLAYCLILLRRDGYPCVFAGDYFGIQGDENNPGHHDILNQLLQIRIKYVYGEQQDFFQDATCIGWVLHGADENPRKLVVGLSTGHENVLHIDLGPDQAGKTFSNLLSPDAEDITLDENGTAGFPIPDGWIGCWVEA